MHNRVDGATRGPCGPLPNQAGKHVHLIGVGGSGMHNAARLLRQMGAAVTGSDAKAFPGIADLVRDGVVVHVGHDGQHLGADVTLVICSAAIPPDNPELEAARRRGIEVRTYAEFAGAAAATRRAIAVAGTHGKSTTTALTAHILRIAGLDPSFIFGAQSEQLGGGGAWSRGGHFVVEACEFGGSFLHIAPRAAAVLNIETDHLDYYRDLDHIIATFARFASQVHPDGVLVCNAADSGVRRMAMDAGRTAVWFGPESADWHAANPIEDRGRYAFDIVQAGRFFCRAELAIAGRHNIGNALAATALSVHAGAPAESIARGLNTFAGINRRMSWRGEANGVTIVDDYAHHPTEIRATLEAAQSQYRPQRTWVVFQPHQHERTRRLMDQFAASFGMADEIIVPDVYGARETDVAESERSAAELADRICSYGGRARYMPSLGDVTGHLIDNMCEGDLVVTMGAGDVWRVADELVARICGPHGSECRSGA